MDLSRRDALAALAAAGAVGGGVALAGRGGDDAGDDTLGNDALDTLVAVAHVVYPSEVEGIEGFVRTYADGRYADRPERRAGLVAAVSDLDAAARDFFDAPVTDLPPEDRNRLLRELGVDTADPVPDGTLSERVRFHVVNELLYALYASPTGGRLVGIENPIGHPGGTESYRRARMEDEDG